MKKLIEMNSDNGTTILVAVDIPEGLVKEEIHKVGVKQFIERIFYTPERVDKNFNAVTDMITKCIRPIVDSFEKIRGETIAPKKATAEFGLSFNTKGNIYLVEASMEGTIKVIFEWEL